MKKWTRLFSLMILALFAVACTPATISETAVSDTNSVAEAPALKSVEPIIDNEIDTNDDDVADQPTTESETMINSSETVDSAVTDRIFDPNASKSGSVAPYDDGVGLQPDGESVEIFEKSELNMAVITYERTGGLMGIRSNEFAWRFYADGRVESAEGATWQVLPETVTQLAATILATGFDEFEASYMPKDTCCDRVTHVITLHVNGAIYRVTTLDGADMPDALADTIDLLNTTLIELSEQ